MAAAESTMGEVDEVHSKGEGDVVMNGEISNDDSSDNKLKSVESNDELMEGVEEEEAKENSSVDEEEKEPQEEEEAVEGSVGNEEEDAATSETGDQQSSQNSENEEQEIENIAVTETDIIIEGDNNTTESTRSENSVTEKTTDKDKEVIEIIHEIDDDDEDDDDVLIEKAKENGFTNRKGVIELNDSGDTDGEDVMFVEESSPKENGDKRKATDESLEIIDLDVTPVKKKKKVEEPITPRRSSRNLNKQKSYAEEQEEALLLQQTQKQEEEQSSEESDVEEVLEEDPLAVMDSLNLKKVTPPPPAILNNKSATIVVKDTKKLVEIASKSNNSNNTNTGGKKEPTLVIIDTNSILSGRGPIPISTKPTVKTPKTQISKPQAPKQQTPKPQIPKSVSVTSSSSYPAILPMALPAQGMYPANMRATITPIPISNAHSQHKTIHVEQHHAPVLPTLTDDMFVVEAPSFIVPYVYEKPPKNDFKEFVTDMEKQIKEMRRKLEEEEEEREKEEREKEEKEQAEKDKENEDTDKKAEAKESNDDKEKEVEKDDENNKKSETTVTEKTDVTIEKKPVNETAPPETPAVATIAAANKSQLEKELEQAKKPYSYFDSPLGKFFIDIGVNLVQEFVQADLLKQQKRKRERERGSNSETNRTIQSLLKNLEYTKENNEPFRMQLKKCEFCNFKTESALAMAYHLETPHMKNYVYKCNFCEYEVRSPHDILFHMEAEHAVRGRLERAPSFHQCSNCPFEDNQKGKLSRHLVACTRKFKPDRNLEPPIDWEPPAKIPRVPKMRQQGLNATAAAYQAMSKTSQYQFLSKMQLQSTNPMLRGRGRPTLPAVSKQPILRPTGMVYKQTMSGGSVLVPTNYHLSGNQVFQVLGGQELGGRLGGHPGQMAYVPTMSSASSTLGIQSTPKKQNQPSISITPLPRPPANASANATAHPNPTGMKPGEMDPTKMKKNAFVICEICDGYIKDLEQLRNHMQWIHKVKIHPKMIYNRPPLNCQKCQFRFFTDQGLERHLLGSHGLVTSSMQDAANKSKDAGRCPVCGRVYQWKLLNHVARDHNMTLKPAHLSYKCTVCTATFGMYKQFENHVYSAHSVVAKRVMDKKGPSSNKTGSDQSMKPLKINDEITIIPQPAKSNNGASTSKEGSPASTGSSNSRNSTPSTSKNAEAESATTTITTTSSTSTSTNNTTTSSLLSSSSSSTTTTRSDRLARRRSTSTNNEGNDAGDD